MPVVSATPTGFTMDHANSGNPGFDTAFDHDGDRFILSQNASPDWFTGNTDLISFSVAHVSTDQGASYSIADSIANPLMPNGKPHVIPAKVGSTAYMWGLRNESDALGPYVEDQTLTLLPFNFDTQSFGVLITGGPNIGPAKTPGEPPSDSLLYARAVVSGTAIVFIHSTASEKIGINWRQRVAVTSYETTTDTWSATVALNSEAGVNASFHPAGIVIDSSGNRYLFSYQAGFPFTGTLRCQLNAGLAVAVTTGVRQLGTMTGNSKPVTWFDGATERIGITINKDGANLELYFYYSDAGLNTWTQELITGNADFQNSVNMGEVSAALFSLTTAVLGVQVGIDGVPSNPPIPFSTRIDAFEFGPVAGGFYAFWYRVETQFGDPGLDAWVEFSIRSGAGWSAPQTLFDIPLYELADGRFVQSIHTALLAGGGGGGGGGGAGGGGGSGAGIGSGMCLQPNDCDYYLGRVARAAQAMFQERRCRPNCDPSFRPFHQMPANGRRFQEVGTLVLPADDGTDNLVLQIRVPHGYDGVLLTRSHQYTGTGFVEGSGDLTWRLQNNFRWFRDDGAITITQGRLNQAYDLDGGGHLLGSNQVVRYFVSVAVGAAARLDPAGRIICSLSGWFYPLGYVPGKGDLNEESYARLRPRRRIGRSY